MPTCLNSWNTRNLVLFFSCLPPCYDSVSLFLREQRAAGYNLYKVWRSLWSGPSACNSSSAWEKHRPGWTPGLKRRAERGLEPCVPLLAGIRVGVGYGQKPHGAQVSSLGQKGQKERRAMGKGEGWRKDEEVRPQGFREGTVPLWSSP